MQWNDAKTKQLVQAVLALNTPSEVKRFLRDLMTEGEIDDIAKRLETARLLQGNTPYPAIQAATGFSTTTIARVSKWLQQGEGGYRLILDRIHHHSPSLARRGLQ